MKEKQNKINQIVQSGKLFVLLNIGMWAISIIAVVFEIQDSPGAKTLLPIVLGGNAAGMLMLVWYAQLRSKMSNWQE